MATTIYEISEAFEFLFESFYEKEFRKSFDFTVMNESKLLPLVRTYLLGYFWGVLPEKRSKLPGAVSGYGRIDFVIDSVAVEFAVRRAFDTKSSLSNITNANEIRKLVKYDGLSLLVLFDFSRRPFKKADLESYREWPSLGKGAHRKSPFNIAYFYWDYAGGGGTRKIALNIRVS